MQQKLYGNSTSMFEFVRQDDAQCATGSTIAISHKILQNSGDRESQLSAIIYLTILVYTIV